MDNIANMCDILLIHEHWFYDSHIHTIGTFDNEMGLFDKSSMNEYSLWRGRPHSGVAIMLS